MAYQELIKNFDKIRDYMREFYIYGFKTRMEYDRKSSRSYDNEKRRIESWLGSYMSNRSDAKGKHVSLRLNPRELSYNPLYQAYKAKSFTDRDITLHFYILDILAEVDSCSGTELYEEILRRMQELELSEPGVAKSSILKSAVVKTSMSEPFMQDWSMDESTLRKKLKEYESLGLIISEKNGRDRNYRLVKDYLPEDFPLELLHFASEALPLGVVASYLQDQGAFADENAPLPLKVITSKVQDQSAFADENADADHGPVLRFLHHNLIHTFDQEVLYQLMICRSEKKMAIVTARSENSNQIHDHHVIPLRFFCSVESNREYLFAYSFTNHQYLMFRLDHIRKVKAGKSLPDFESYEKRSQEIRKHLWGVSLKRMNQSNLEHVEMIFRFSPEDDFLLKRLMQEKRCGEVKKITDFAEYPELSAFADDVHTLWIFTCDIYDARELLPWARTFIGSLLRFRCSDSEITDIFYRDLEEMKKSYLLKSGIL